MAQDRFVEGYTSFCGWLSMGQSYRQHLTLQIAANKERICPSVQGSVRQLFLGVPLLRVKARRLSPAQSSTPSSVPTATARA